MRPAVAALALMLVASACAGQPSAFRDMAACLRPSSDQSARSLAALVDRADIIVLATVTKAVSLAPSAPPGGAVRDLFRTYDDDGQRVTLRVSETLKGSAASEVVVYDAPCQMLAAKTGETMIALLEGPPLADGMYRPIGLPLSALRATADRTLAQLASEIRAVRPLDGDAAALFARHGWSVSGKHQVDELVLPPAERWGLAGLQLRTLGVRLAEPFARYASLSSEVGLDPRPYAGRPAEILSFFLEGKRGEFPQGATLGHVLIADRRIVGAWVSVFPELGTFSLRDRAAALAAPAPTGRVGPPANRVPQGINIARAYGLATARQIAFKTGAGGGGEITDAATIRAFVDALDVTLPTAQAPDDRAQPPTRHWFHIDLTTGSLSLQYDSADGSLVVWLDGFTAKAPAAFARLVETLPRR